MPSGRCQGKLDEITRSDRWEVGDGIIRLRCVSQEDALEREEISV